MESETNWYAKECCSIGPKMSGNKALVVRITLLMAPVSNVLQE